MAPDEEATEKARRGRILRTLRKRAGLTQNDVARELGVHPSAVGKWEKGETTPRPKHHNALAELFGITREALFLSSDIDQPPPLVESLDVIDELGDRALQCLDETRGIVYDARLSQPHAMPVRMRGGYVHSGFWKAVSERLLEGSIEVRRVEVIYSKDRLKDIMWNIKKYEHVKYSIKYYLKTPGPPGIMPAISLMSFDYVHFFVGAYFVDFPPPEKHRQMLWLRGEPFASFFREYFELLYDRAPPLSPSGSDGWQEVRKVAESIGISDEDFERLLEEVTAAKEPDYPPRI